MALTKKQAMYIEYVLAHPTESDCKISDELGIPKATFTRWRKIPEFAAEYEKALKQNWNKYAKEAQKVVHDMLYTDRPELALKAATYILDSCGYKATDKVEVSGVDTITVNIVDE